MAKAIVIRRSGARAVHHCDAKGDGGWLLRADGRVGGYLSNSRRLMRSKTAGEPGRTQRASIVGEPESALDGSRDHAAGPKRSRPTHHGLQRPNRTLALYRMGCRQGWGRALRPGGRPTRMAQYRQGTKICQSGFRHEETCPEDAASRDSGVSGKEEEKLDR